MSALFKYHVYTIDAGPTQEVTPPCSDVQNSPLPKLREGAAGEQLPSRGP